MTRGCAVDAGGNAARCCWRSRNDRSAHRRLDRNRRREASSTTRSSGRSAPCDRGVRVQAAVSGRMKKNVLHHRWSDRGDRGCRQRLRRVRSRTRSRRLRPRPSSRSRRSERVPCESESRVPEAGRPTSRPTRPTTCDEEFDSPATVEAIARRVPLARAHALSNSATAGTFLEAVLKDPPDLVFNFAEGSGISRSREARVPAVCEMLGIPYTGSDPLALAVALDKDMTRRVVESLGVTCPEGDHARPAAGRVRRRLRRVPADSRRSRADAPGDREADLRGVEQGHSQPLRDPRRRPTSARRSSSCGENYRQPVLVEEFIVGRRGDGRDCRQRPAAVASASCG